MHSSTEPQPRAPERAPVNWVTTSLQLPPDIAAALRNERTRTGESQASIIRTAIRQTLIDR
jgi:predicted DNA-binding protein